MNGSSDRNRPLLEGIVAQASTVDRVDIGVCVPFPYLDQARSMLVGSAVDWGAQNVSDHAAGAFTGEVSVAMLADFGCKYVIVGHSERRAYHAEDDALVNAKLGRALAAGRTMTRVLGGVRL